MNISAIVIASLVMATLILTGRALPFFLPDHCCPWRRRGRSQSRLLPLLPWLVRLLILGAGLVSLHLAAG